MGTIIGFAALGIGVVFALAWLVTFVILKITGEGAAVSAYAGLLPATFVAVSLSISATIIIVILAILNSIFHWGL